MRPAVRLLLLLGTLALGVAVYQHGLHGSFLFDDYANLPKLGAFGPIRDGASFWRYVTSGTADPTGRPLSLLSFLIDARDWPAAPSSFKRTNLALHLVNGTLLFTLLRRLGGQIPGAPQRPVRVELAAWLGAMLWLLHPLFVSTTLYVVQREAMLPVTFTLLGLLLWLRGRDAFYSSNTVAGWAYLTAGLALCTALSTLSKANGILLPALALVVEVFFLKAAEENHWRPTERRQYRWALGVLAATPTLLVGGYLLYEGWQGLAHDISSVRPWTLGQRLLTEPRVLMEYMNLLWLPRPFTTGLFNDQYEVSTSLFSPLTTLPALVAVFGLLGMAWHLRRRAPALALAIAFYFAGQCMESSTLALELYFEHRNYLPATLMFWPLALFLCGVPVVQKQPASAPRPLLNDHARAFIAAVLVIGLAWMCHARADLWGNTRDQALLWAKLNPASPRAQAYAAHAEMQSGHPKLAIARLRPAFSRRPNEVQIALNLLAAECQQGHIEQATFASSLLALRTTRDTGSLLASWFGRVIDQSRAPVCPEMNLVNIAALLDAAEANPYLAGIAGRRQDFRHLRGRIALVQRRPHAALAAFNAALDQQVRATTAFEQAALLGSAGYPEEGLAHLDHYQAEQDKEINPEMGMALIHAWVLKRQHYWDRELVRLRETLREDVRTHPTLGSA